MNYAELVTQIQDYMETTFDTDSVNTFIKQAEHRIYNTVQIPSLRKNVTGSTSSSNKYLQCPSDFLAVYSLAIIKANGDYVYLLNKDVNFMRQVYPNPTSTGQPKYYAIFDNTTFILGPTPDAGYNMELHYYGYPTSIVDAVSGTSWLGNNFDSVLLYGSLLEAYTFMKGEADVIQNYLGRYNEALMQLKQLGEGKDRQDTYRTMQARVPVQ